MLEEEDGAQSGRSSPPTPKKVQMESEEPKELVKVEDHSEAESKEIEDDDGDEDEDEDGSPPGWQQSPSLLDMMDLPPSSQLPPTPPLPSSPRDLNMEQQESEDDGPPPGWDKSYHLQERVEQTLAFAAILAISSGIKMEQDVRIPEVVATDTKVEEQDSEEDDGPPPGWDSKCQPEPELQVACPAVTQSDISYIKTEDAQIDQPRQPEDIKMEEQESEEDEGPPPGWDTKCQPEPEPELITQPDIKTDSVQPQHPNPAPQFDPSDMKVEEQDSEEDDGPPPGWDSKCPPEPELQTPNPRTPPLDMKTPDILLQDAQNGNGPQPQPLAPLDIKVEEQESEDEGPPPGWGSTPQPHSNLPSPILSSGPRMECEQQRNLEVVGERPMKQQPPPTTKSPEMGQMVCGSCKRLLSYPKGARYVECGCCLEENYVLEEHEVGQVICGGCDVLLMYPFGAPKVRCVNCTTETEIGDQNRRPPLSEQQRRGRRHLKRVQMGKC